MEQLKVLDAGLRGFLRIRARVVHRFKSNLILLQLECTEAYQIYCKLR